MTARQALGFAGAVGDVKDGDAGFAVDVLEEAAHFLVQFLVEGGERFVEAKDGGAMGERAAEGDACADDARTGRCSRTLLTSAWGVHLL